MPGIKELKTRIKSISGTRKVTRAMQMVSAAKMRKSQDATTRSRSYSSLAWELIQSLSSSSAISSESDASRNLLSSDNQELTDPSARPQMHSGLVGMEHLMMSFPKATKIAVLILTTNRGMVGSLNTNLINLVQKTIDSETRSVPSDKENTKTEGTLRAHGADIITYGRKGRDVMVRNHKEVLADFEKFDRTITTEDIFPISELITKLYSSGKYQKVLIFYNHFVSTLAQKPTVKQLLPFAADSTQYSVHNTRQTENRVLSTEYLFEPDPAEVLKHLLPRIIESQIYQTILESEASEQSARMVMMKNATEAAGDLISDLTLTYNKLRQNKITTELAEITAGKIALE